MLAEKPTKLLLYLLVLALVFEVVWLVYTVPAQTELTGIPYPDERLGYTGDTSWGVIELRIYAAIVVFTVQSVVLALLTLFAYRASKMFSGIPHLTLKHFYCFSGTLLIASILVAVGHMAFAYLKTSIVLGDPIGMIYVSTLLYSMALAAVAPYYLLNFGYLYATGSFVDSRVEKLFVGVILIIWVAMISPYNWYAMYPLDASMLDLRPLTNGLILLVNVVVIVKLIGLFRSRIKSEADPIKRVRLQTILWGLVLYLVFFVWFVLEEAIKHKYLFTYFLAYSVSMLAVVFMYLGLVAPDFYRRYLEKRLGITS